MVGGMVVSSFLAAFACERAMRIGHDGGLVLRGHLINLYTSAVMVSGVVVAGNARHGHGQ
jgi:hypothetical protein